LKCFSVSLEKKKYGEVVDNQR